MKNRICPVCGQRIWYPDTTIDFVHQCRNRDGTRKTSREFKFHPNRQIIKFDDPNWNMLGKGMGQGTIPIPKKEIKKIMRELTDVDTFIEV